MNASASYDVAFPMLPTASLSPTETFAAPVTTYPAAASETRLFGRLAVIRNLSLVMRNAR